MTTKILRKLRWLRPIHFRAVAQTCGLLGLIAGAVVMAIVLTFFVDDVAALIISNTADKNVRTALLVAPAASALVTISASLLAILFGGQMALSCLARLARFSSPLALSWALPVLACHEAWKPNPLHFLLLLLAFALALERTLRFTFENLPTKAEALLQRAARSFETAMGRRLAISFVLLGCLGYSAYFSFHTIQEHHRLTTGTLDLGISDNLMANMLAGQYFRVPALLPDGSSMLKGHALFGAFFFLPFYAIKPCSETLLIMQATLMGFAALPLYLFATTQVRRAYAVVISYCYLLSPIVHGPNFYDFHFLSTAPIFHFCLYFGLAKKNPWVVGLSWLALILLREDLSMTLIPLGCVLALSGVRVKYGLFLAIASAIAFVVIKFVIMPAAGTWFFSDHYAGLYLPGERSYASAIVTIITNPTLLFTSLFTEAKLIFALHIFAPLLFLTWRNGWLFVATLGAFPSTFMVTDGPYVTNIGFQYVTHWVPYVFAGAVVALALLKRKPDAPSRKAATTLALLSAVVLHSLVFGAVLQKTSFSAAAKPIPLKMTAAEKKEYQGLVELRNLIPKDAVIAATPQMYPHVSSWVDAYDLEIAHKNAAYLLVSPRSIKKAYRTLRPLLKDVPYELVAQKGTIYLFKRGQDTAESRQAWASLGIRLRRPR